MKTPLSAMAVIFFVAVVNAQTVWLFIKPETVNYDSLRLQVLSEQLNQELGVQGNITVKKSDRPASDSGSMDDPAFVKSLLQKNGATVAFSGKISSLDHTVFIYLQKWNSSGTATFRERTSVQTGEDPDALVKRLAACLIKEEPFVATATTTTITKKDNQVSRRKGSGMLLVGRAGFLYPMGNNSFRTWSSNWGYDSAGNYRENSTANSGPAFSLEGGFAFDVDFMIMETTMSFDGLRDLSFTIGGEYPFGKGDFCPYIGGEIGATIVGGSSIGSSNENRSNGMSLGLRAGILIFRNYTFKLMPELRLFTVLNSNHDTGVRFTVGGMMF